MWKSGQFLFQDIFKIKTPWWVNLPNCQIQWWIQLLERNEKWVACNFVNHILLLLPFTQVFGIFGIFHQEHALKFRQICLCFIRTEQSCTDLAGGYVVVTWMENKMSSADFLKINSRKNIHFFPPLISFQL